MDTIVPCPEDHCGLFIYVKLCTGGSNSSPSSATTNVNFNKVVERLKRFDAVNVTDDAPIHRSVQPNFVTNLIECKTSWGEFQMHRKVLGLIAVGFLDDADDGDESTSMILDDIFSQYTNLKETFRSSLVDSRCILFGYKNIHDSINCNDTSSASIAVDGGLLKYANFDNFKKLDMDIKDYIKALFWVLESRRLDTSFESMDNPPCPMAPDEEKYFVGIDRSGRSYRKRCIGRLRKQLADSTLMTGLPVLALEAYNSAIDALKSANDWLWLAGATEGYICAALIIKFSKNNHNQGLRRVATFTSGQMRKLSSEENSNLASDFMVKTQKNSLESSSSSSSSPPKNNFVGKNSSILSEDIEEKVRMAIENYRKFSIASGVECECVLKSASLFIAEKRYLALDNFLRDYCCARFLNEEYKFFDDYQKAQICLLIASLYKKIGFERKNSFYLRLSALFRLHSGADSSITSIDYRQVYPVLLSSMDGYGLSMNSKNEQKPHFFGWPAVRFRALHELFVAAQRGQYRDASIRHLAHFIHSLLEYLDETTLRQLCGDLKQICQESVHVANAHLSVANNIILPPISLIKLPKILHFSVRPLPPYLLPKEMIIDEAAKIFIYSPFQNISSNKKVLWVAGCTCVVEAKIINLLPIELEVKKLVVQCEGVDYDVSPILLVLPPKSDVVSVKLLITPRSPGSLSITGYSCEVLNVKTFCRVDDLVWLRNRLAPKVDVVPPLPELEINTSLSRGKGSPLSDSTEICSAEIFLYSGQKSCQNVLLQNKSSLPIAQIDCEIKQPAVSGGPQLVEWVRPDDFCSSVGPKSNLIFQLIINGVDPLAVVDEQHQDSDEKIARQEMIKSIPYTGRLLVASVQFSYVGGENSVKYQRNCSLTLYITISPIVVIVDWHVLPGESSTTRYLALDVINACESEVDIEFATDKLLTVQPKDICRVPVLCECCKFDETTFDLPVARGPLAKQYLLAARRKMLQKHLLLQLDVRWKLASGETGSVPLGYFMKSLSLRDDLIISPLSAVITINDSTNSALDYAAGVGEMNSLKLELISDKNLELKGKVYLSCYQDLQNGLTLLSDQILLVGPRLYTVSLNEERSRFESIFEFIFASEGSYKIEVKFDLETSLFDRNSDFPFRFPLLPVYTFNVGSRSI